MNNMLILILFLIFLLIIFIYNNTNHVLVESYMPRDYSSALNITICQEESYDIITPKYDREFNLNELKSIIKNKINDKQKKSINFYQSQDLTKLVQVKTYIDTPFYHTYNLEALDNYESTKSDYSIINNIKLKKNQAYLPKNHSLQVE